MQPPRLPGWNELGQGVGREVQGLQHAVRTVHVFFAVDVADREAAGEFNVELAGVGSGRRSLEQGIDLRQRHARQVGESFAVDAVQELQQKVIAQAGRRKAVGRVQVVHGHGLPLLVFSCGHYPAEAGGLEPCLLGVFGVQRDPLFAPGGADAVGEAEVKDPVAGLGKVRRELQGR